MISLWTEQGKQDIWLQETYSNSQLLLLAPYHVPPSNMVSTEDTIILANPLPNCILKGVQGHTLERNKWAGYMRLTCVTAHRMYTWLQQGQNHWSVTVMLHQWLEEISYIGPASHKLCLALAGVNCYTSVSATFACPPTLLWHGTWILCTNVLE